MNLKSLIAVFIVVGIAVMLLRTESGMTYLTGVMDFFNIRVGNFVSGLFGAKGPWGPEDGFGIILTADKSSFLEQKYQLYNSSVSATGLVEGIIKIGGVELHKDSMQIQLEMDAAKGEFEYTVAGTMRFEGSVEKIVVDGNSYTPSTGGLKVVFELYPIQFLVTNLSEKRIILEKVTGSIARMNPDGSIKSTEELAAEEIEISQFAGSLELSGSITKLQGSAFSVKGTSEQSSFRW